MNAKCQPKRLLFKTLSIVLAMMILTGCSTGGAAVPPSDDHGEAVSQTYEATVENPTDTPAPTATPVPPTDTPAPTDTPIPPTDTPTTTPTSTPLPSPDAKAMIAWKELDLSSEFEAFSPEAIGMEEGANALTLSDGKEYNILGSFLFANGANPDTLIYGYTISLPTAADRQTFDEIIDDINNYGASGMNDLEGADTIGNHSKGATGELDNSNFSIVAFRLDNIGAMVFLRHEPGSESGIDPVQVAQVYARSIDESVPYCKITSAKAVPNSDNPTFEVEAEGFYPQEGRYILLEGAILVNGETITIMTGKMGGGGETVEPDGSLKDVIGIDIKEQLASKGYKDVQLPEGPIEFTLTVGGHFSGCEASQTVTWP